MAKKRSRNKKKGGKKAPPTAPVDAAPAQPPAIPSTTGPVDAKTKSKAFKKKGNAAFVKKDFEAAVTHFTKQSSGSRPATCCGATAAPL